MKHWIGAAAVVLSVFVGVAGAGPASEDFFPKSVFFAQNDHRLDAAAKATLDAVALWLAQHPDIRIWIEGYGDRRGSREANLIAGEKRSGSVKSYLIRRGISPDRLSCISYGEEVSASDAGTHGGGRLVRLVVRDLF
jgi:outer membrane protein OmpA-like peptidoglycan-associated protein